MALTDALRHNPDGTPLFGNGRSFFPTSRLPGLLATWAGREPDRALDWVVTTLAPAEQARAADTVFHQIDVRSPHVELLRTVALSPEHPAHASAASRYQAVLDELPPSEVWEHVRRGAWAFLPWQAAASLGDHLATLPDDALREAFLTNPPPAAVDPDRLTPLLDAWAFADPEAAAKWSRDLTDEHARHRAVQHLLPLLAETAPELALDTYAAFPPGHVRDQLAANLAVTFSHLDPALAFDFATSLALPDERSSALRALGESAAKRDPAAFAQLLATDPALTAHGWPLPIEFAANWSEHDPAAALLWLQAQPRDRDRGWHYDKTLAATARHAPDALLDLINALPHSANRTAFIAAFAGEHTLGRPAEVAALIASVPGERARTTLHAASLRAIAAADPDHAASLIAAGTFGPTDIRHLNALAETWAKRSAADAARWFDTLPPELRTSGAIASRIAADLARQDPEAAVPWYHSLPENSRAREIGAWNVSSGLAERYPTRAWAIALAAPESVRVEQVTRTYRHLRAANSPLAERLLRDPAISPELRDAVLAASP